MNDNLLPPTAIRGNDSPPITTTPSGFKASREDLHEAVVSALDDLRTGLDALDAVRDWVDLARETAEALDEQKTVVELDAVVLATADAKGYLAGAESDLESTLERTRESEAGELKNDESDIDAEAADPTKTNPVND
jgi:hypothetical protein